MIVVDVNVVAYALIEGTHTAAAEQVLRLDPEWSAPLLWRSEWRGILAGYLRRRQLDRGGAIERLRTGEALVHGREYAVDGERVLDLVAGSHCSAYDCEYVALAELLSVPLVTSDRRLLQDFPAIAVAPEDFAPGA